MTAQRRLLITALLIGAGCASVSCHKQSSPPSATGNASNDTPAVENNGIADAPASIGNASAEATPRGKMGDILSNTVYHRDVSGDIRTLMIGRGADADAQPVYILCSKKLPAVMMKDDGNWQVDIIDFHSVPDTLVSSATFLSAACNKTDAKSAPGPDDMVKQGWAYDGSNGDPDIDISKPEDIYQYLKSMPAQQ